MKSLILVLLLSVAYSSAFPAEPPRGNEEGDAKFAEVSILYVFHYNMIFE